MIMISPAVDDISSPVALRDIIFLTRGAHAERSPRPPLVVLPQIHDQIRLLVSCCSTSFSLHTLEFVQLTFQPRVRDVLPHQCRIVGRGDALEGRCATSSVINVPLSLKPAQPGQPEVALEGRAAADLLVEAVLAPRGC